MSELLISVKNLEEITDKYRASLSSVQKGFQTRERTDLLSWISSPVNPSLHHNRAIRSREPETGQWFLVADEFSHWFHHPGLLWLHGIRKFLPTQIALWLCIAWSTLQLYVRPY
jgi:hypothetical protein